MSVQHDAAPRARATGRRGLSSLHVLLALTVVLALGGAVALTLGMSGAPGPVRVAPPPAAPLTPAGAAAVVAPVAPASLDIPAIDVHTPLLTLGQNPDGTVEVPPLDSLPEANEAGWYDGSPPPGTLGPAVILGHVDSQRFGPSVFHDLAALLPGDRMDVTRTDGSVVTFQVDSVARYPKARFPTDAVYGDIDHAGLRLITCGGEFDSTAHSYEDNVVVYASAISTEQPG